MIKEFKVSGFSLFEKPIELSLVPTDKKIGLEENIIRLSNTKRFVKSAVIYGANNTGKTSLVTALKLMKEIVLNGHVDSFPFTRYLPYTGNNDEVHFEINFIASSKNIVYGIKFKNITRIGEYLIVNDKLYFKRDTNGIISEFDDNTTLNKIDNLQTNRLIVSYVANNITGSSHIPIACGLVMDLFKTIKFVDRIDPKTFSSFISDQKRIDLLNKLIEVTNLYILKRELINKEVIIANPKLFQYLDLKVIDGVCPGNGYDNIDAIIDTNCIISHYKTTNESISAPSYVFDSPGTNRFIEKAMHIINALLNKETLIIDNFDNNIHLSLLVMLIKLMNSEVNTASQFILTTLDSRFLTLEHLRKDQLNIMVRNDAATTPFITRLDQPQTEDDIKDIDITNIINAIKNHLNKHP